jgi:hypothetical protein
MDLAKIVGGARQRDDLRTIGNSALFVPVELVSENNYEVGTEASLLMSQDGGSLMRDTKATRRLFLLVVISALMWAVGIETLSRA